MPNSEFQREMEWHVANLENYIDGISTDDGGEGDLLNYFMDAAGTRYIITVSVLALSKR